MNICPFCKAPLRRGATKCLCGATYRRGSGGCLTTLGQFFIIGVSLVWWSVVWLAFAMGQTGGTIGFITFFVGNFVTINLGVRLWNKLTWRKAWYSQDEVRYIRY